MPWKCKKMEKMRTTNSHTKGAGSDLTAEHRKEGRDPNDNVSLLESRRSLLESRTLAKPVGLVV